MFCHVLARRAYPSFHCEERSDAAIQRLRPTPPATPHRCHCEEQSDAAIQRLRPTPPISVPPLSLREGAKPRRGNPAIASHPAHHFTPLSLRGA
jgi:hypothetical protein